MTIDLTPQEIKFISEALAIVDDKPAGRYVMEFTVRQLKALRLKIDSALLGAMEEKK